MRMYMPARCHLCPDYSAEFADISCSDIFLGGKDGNYKHSQGSTLLICRTETGQRVVNALMQAGLLRLDPVDSETIEKSYSHVKRHRKAIPFLRIEKLKKQGKQAPDFGIQVPAKPSNHLYDLFYRFTYILTGIPWARIPVLRFLYSPVGQALIGLKVKVKKYRRGLIARREASKKEKYDRSLEQDSSRSGSGEG